jgi:N-acetyl-gamma-glutamyl-phosphate reductase
VTENVQPYKVEGHRHAAELEQELNGTSFTFVPHLVPVEQGLLATCYATTGLSAAEVAGLYREAYEHEPFIDLVDEPPGTDEVRETNRCRVHVTSAGDRVIAIAAIDNLWKGAAGQAVQDLNLMLGLPETEGLE